MASLWEDQEDEDEQSGSEDGEFFCVECKDSFQLRTDWLRHMTKFHDGSTDVPCPVVGCNTKVSDKAQLSQHITLVHRPDTKQDLTNVKELILPKPFCCLFETCDKRFVRKSHLSRHIREVHKEEPRDVAAHIYTTSGNKKVPCVFADCKTTFTNNSHLQRHLRVVHREGSPRKGDSGAKNTKIPCVVDGCSTTFTNQSHLKRHLRVVHKKDPKKVAVPRKIIPQKKGTSHKKKKIQCVFDDCSTGFSNKSHLTRHIRQVHKTDPQKVEDLVEKAVKGGASSSKSKSSSQKLVPKTKAKAGSSQKAVGSERTEEDEEDNDKDEENSNDGIVDNGEGISKKSSSKVASDDGLQSGGDEAASSFGVQGSIGRRSLRLRHSH